MIPMASTASTKPPPAPEARRRRVCACLLVALAVVLALAAALLVLNLTVLRVRDPTTRVVSARLAGVAFPAVVLRLNVTLLLTVAVHNPNPASFAYSSGHANLTYRGARVGEAEIHPGRIPGRGDGEVRLALTVQADRLAADVESGAVPMEATTRIPGTVSILRIFERNAVAYSECKFVIGVAEMRVRSQECNGRTKL